VSLPTDIIQFFGPGSFVAGSVLGVFELGERFASQRAKDDLSKWLLTFDVQKAKALPNGTQELFERIFGERHFSLKCFVRSAAFSLGAIIVITIIFLLVDPTRGLRLVNDAISKSFFTWFFVLWFPWSIIIDYVSLFKTRVILRILTSLQPKPTLLSLGPLILLMDYFVYRFLFVFGYALNESLLGLAMNPIPEIPSITNSNFLFSFGRASLPLSIHSLRRRARVTNKART